MIDTYGFYTNDDPAEFVPFGEASSMKLEDLHTTTQTSGSTFTANDVKIGSEILVVWTTWANSSLSPKQPFTATGADYIDELFQLTTSSGSPTIYDQMGAFIYKATSNNVSIAISGVVCSSVSYTQV